MIKIERLFIAEYEAMKQWTAGKREILNRLQDSDYYLIFQTGKSDQTLSAIYQNVLENMGDHKEIIDATGMTDAQYDNLILQKISQYINAETHVFFLQMEDCYKRLKPHITKIPAQHIYSKPTYKVEMRHTQTFVGNRQGQAAVQNTDNAVSSKKQQDRKKSQRPQKPQLQNRSFEDSADQVFNGMVDTLLETPTTAQKDTLSTADKAQEFYQQFSGKATPMPARPLSAGMPNAVAGNTPLRGTPQNHPLGKPGQKPSPQKSYVQSKSPQTDNTDAGLLTDNLITIDDLEKRIFDSKINTGEFIREYSDLDRKKAVLIQAMFDRTVNSICSLLQINGKDSKPHSTDDFVQFMTILLKSKDFNDFNNSLTSVDPSSDLKIQKSTTYTYLLDEVHYYARLCEVLYSEDQWN